MRPMDFLAHPRAASQTSHGPHEGHVQSLRAEALATARVTWTLGPTGFGGGGGTAQNPQETSQAKRRSPAETLKGNTLARETGTAWIPYNQRKNLLAQEVQQLVGLWENVTSKRWLKILPSSRQESVRTKVPFKVSQTSLPKK